jgi:Major Facilitator Superfamily
MAPARLRPLKTAALPVIVPPHPATDDEIAMMSPPSAPRRDSFADLRSPVAAAIPAGGPPSSEKAFNPPLEHSAVRAIIAGIMLAMFLSALEQTIVAPALPTIGVLLGDLENLSWVVGAYLLTATAVTPLFGKLSDIYGRPGVLLAGVSIFIIGSVACALAPSLWVLVAARALQGIRGRRHLADRTNHHR